MFGIPEQPTQTTKKVDIAGESEESPALRPQRNSFNNSCANNKKDVASVVVT